MPVQPRQSKLRIADRDSLSSVEGTDGSETIVSEGASHESYSYYTFPSVAIVRLFHLFMHAPEDRG